MWLTFFHATQKENIWIFYLSVLYAIEMKENWSIQASQEQKSIVIAVQKLKHYSIFQILLLKICPLINLPAHIQDLERSSKIFLSMYNFFYLNLLMSELIRFTDLLNHSLIKPIRFSSSNNSWITYKWLKYKSVPHTCSMTITWV